ncbi:MAG: hypothetical protein H5T73_03285 [Actinobacteria bacterium]|nr:hypothetical protein [Actinomycetota bacterium]
MQRDDILRLMRRIVRDFAPLLPGIRLEVVSPEGFRARLRGRPLLADEASLRKALQEGEGRGSGRASSVRRGEQAEPGEPGETGEPVEAPVPGEPGESVEAPVPLLHTLPSTRTIIVEMEGLYEKVSREDRRLHRPLVEGMILREVIYLATSRQPFPDPRARAEAILRRHWPFQFAALRSVGLTMTGFGRPASGPELAKGN